MRLPAGDLQPSRGWTGVRRARYRGIADPFPDTSAPAAVARPTPDGLPAARHRDPAPGRRHTADCEPGKPARQAPSRQWPSGRHAGAAPAPAPRPEIAPVPSVPDPAQRPQHRFWPVLDEHWYPTRSRADRTRNFGLRPRYTSQLREG